MDTEPQSGYEPKPEMNPGSSRDLLFRRIGLGIGLLLVLAGVIMFFVPSDNSESSPEEEIIENAVTEEGENYDEFFSPLPTPPYTKEAEEQTADAIYHRALQAYDEKNYSEAIDLFREALQNSDFAARSGAEASLYLGISLLETKQALPALQILEPYELHPDYKHDVRWYQALGFIQLDQRENVLHTLFSIARDPDHPHTLSAQILLREFVPDAEE